ncbi:MAG: hypothetical protein K2X87_18615 [Gemmataceae bacterium]|nr:hypothetical protein [Gemmataceae bacterium]
MADKLSQQITDALGRAAADPGGLPLFAGKGEAGLFPAAAKPAAQRCLADGLLRAVRTDTKGRSARELYALTDAGWDYLLAAVNPKQVLEDFVRVLEARQGEVGELLVSARRMADGLHGLREAVARVLPQVTASRVQGPLPPAPSGGSTKHEARSTNQVAEPTESSDFGFRDSDFPRRGPGGGVGSETAVLEAPSLTLADAIVAQLAGWAGSASAGEDCPLPELYRRLAADGPAPSIGAFHDGMRELHAAGAVYLHPWTGPLYALPEPAYALLIGHGVAYYASIRH